MASGVAAEGESFTIATSIKEDGSVQILSILYSPDAPTSYDYEFDLPAGASIDVTDDGTAIVTGAAGEFLGAAAPAWALDGNGVVVPTHYEVSGDVLTQVVETDASTSFPVVADPWLGIRLYNDPYVTTESRGSIVNVTPTPWGSETRGPQTWFAHRDEIVSELGSDSDVWNDSIQEQLYCHIAGWPASLPEYNLESWRPVMYFAEQLVGYRCNYPEGAWS